MAAFEEFSGCRFVVDLRRWSVWGTDASQVPLIGFCKDFCFGEGGRTNFNFYQFLCCQFFLIQLVMIRLGKDSRS